VIGWAFARVIDYIFAVTFEIEDLELQDRRTQQQLKER